MINKRGVLIALYVIAGLPVVAVLGSGIWLYTDLYQTSDRFEAEIKAGNAEIPTEPADFTRISPPSSQDATAEIEKAVTNWEKLSEQDRIATLTRVQLYAITPEAPHPTYVLAYNSSIPLINSLRSAADRRDSAFTREWAGDSDLLEPHYHSLIQLARLYCSVALAEARAGSIRAAFDDLHRLRKIAKHYSRDGGLDSLAAHVKIETQALTAANEIAALYGKNPEVLRQFKVFINDRSTQPDLARSMEGEAMRCIYVLSQPDSFQDRMFAGTKLSIKNELFQRAAAVRMSEFWTEALALAKEFAPDPFTMSDSYATVSRAFNEQKSPSRLIPAAIARWNESRIALAGVLEARYALAQTAAEIYRTFHQKGQYPESLNETDSRTFDPYADSPFTYTKTSEGFKLYSIGTNRLDDGGETKRTDPPQDIVLQATQNGITIEGT
jgi:hypothetical protein